MAQKYIGEGAYSLPQAARIIHADPRRLRRWILGYEYQARAGDRRSRPAVVSGAGESINGYLTLGFRDLIELWFVKQFLRAGVSMHTVRRAAVRARQLVKVSHPFSSQRFLTDGRRILARVQQETGDPELFDLLNDQLEWEGVLGPFLHSMLEFDGDECPVRYWPLGRERSVVLDRERAFGAPIAARSGIRTAVLKAAFDAEGSEDSVAAWYATDVAEVTDAVEYELSLAA